MTTTELLERAAEILAEMMERRDGVRPTKGCTRLGECVGPYMLTVSERDGASTVHFKIEFNNTLSLEFPEQYSHMPRERWLRPWLEQCLDHAEAENTDDNLRPISPTPEQAEQMAAWKDTRRAKGWSSKYGVIFDDKRADRAGRCRCDYTAVFRLPDGFQYPAPVETTTATEDSPLLRWTPSEEPLMPSLGSAAPEIRSARQSPVVDRWADAVRQRMDSIVSMIDDTCDETFEACPDWVTMRVVLGEMRDEIDTALAQIEPLAVEQEGSR